MTTLKIIFNGFDVNVEDGLIKSVDVEDGLIKSVDVKDGSIERIYQAILTALKGKKLRTLWLHTNNLRKCRIEDFKQMFNIINWAGAEITCEEISIQMSDW